MRCFPPFHMALSKSASRSVGCFTSVRYTNSISTMSARLHSTFTVPPGAWDTHMHVTDLKKFPPQKTGNANYKPHSSTLQGAHKNAERLAVPNLAFVQPSTYGTDNSCLLWCLDQVTPEHGRGVVVINPEEISSQELLDWHKRGVRGVRVNLKSVGSEPSSEELRKILGQVDRVISPLKTWGIHIYADIRYMEILRHIIPDLSSKVCIDHFGSPAKGTIGPELCSDKYWAALKQLLEDEKVFVKVSAPYRFLDPADWHRFEKPVKELLACRKGRAAVFASDWPHTRFESTNIKPWVDLCLHWCGEDEALRYNFFKGNAERLYDAQES